MVPQCVVVCLALLATAAATAVEKCPDSAAEENTLVELNPCKRSPCKLKKGTDQHISMQFTPGEDVSDVKNHVTAEVFGVPLPFVGVDGNSICDKIFTPSGEKASCPLKGGTTYLYKDSFHIYNFYPNLGVRVHWALQTGKKDLSCFEVPAKISN